MATTSLYPLSNKEELVKQYAGKSVKDIATPAAVLDLKKLRTNCNRMLEACESMKFGWRAHIKTHKTTELTRLQVGPGPGPANIIVSTIIEAEHILPLLLEYKSQGRSINLLYSFPVAPSSAPRLALLAKALGPRNLSLIIDNPAQLPSITSIHATSGVPPSIFLKIDMGGNRAGIPPLSPTANTLITSLLTLETQGVAHFLGLYAHAGHSYSGSSPLTALTLLHEEFSSLLTTAKQIHTLSPSVSHPLVLSVGATPTSTSIRNLLSSPSPTSPELTQITTSLLSTIDAIRSLNHTIEIHAGVYPALDLQQLSTNALPTHGPTPMLTWDNLALTIIAEIASVYPGRGKNGETEALIGAGTLALGREPCKAYPGWGIVTPWGRQGVQMPVGDVAGYEGWGVGRISQEHGILTWRGGEGEALGGNGTGEGMGEEFEVGQKVRIWPNHACIAGSGYGWYLIVDGGDEIVDVWVRWRGW